MILFLAALAVGITVSPYLAYKETIKGNYFSKYFKLDHYSDFYLSPERYPYYLDRQKSADNLWKDIHIGDVIVPLPYRNPLYKVLPVLKHTNKKNFPDMGLKFYDIHDREIARIYFVPNGQFRHRMNAQELFKLPISRNILGQVSEFDIWSDIFSKPIENKKNDYPEMIYNLYLIQLRHDLLPQEAVGYGHIGQPEIGIVRLGTQDKDFNSELVMTMKNRMIYSYVLFTRKQNEEALELRDRLIRRIKFQRGSLNIAQISYKEFKTLPFRRRSSSEGLLYLYAAWSNWEAKREELMKEMIFYMEKGGMDSLLDNIYNYALKVYGSTFTSKNSSEIDDPYMKMQKMIEEEDERKIEEDKVRSETKTDEQIKEENTLENKLRRAKDRRKNKKKKRGKMILN